MAGKSPEKFRTQENVFDRFTIANLFKLEKYFDGETLSPVSIGKESNIFSAKARVGDKDRLILKIHRLEASDFNTIYTYIRADPRFTGLKKRRREVIFAWAQREFRNMMEAREANVSVPMPIAFLKNIIIMEYIGAENPAPQLKDAEPDDPKGFLDKTLEQMRRYYRQGFVHGDLSKFNILNWKEKPVLIDFSHGTPVRNPNAGELLKRDAVNVLEYFRKSGVKTDVEKALKKIKN